MAVVSKKCYYSNTSKFIQFYFYSSACREVASSCIPNIIESLIHITTEAEKFSQHLMEELLRQYNNVSSGELKNLSSLLVEILVRYLRF